jgi:hypothetical protein
MKKRKRITVLLLPAIMAVTGNARAQSEEVQQLLLNVEKLAQLKGYLTELQKTYQTLAAGYNAVKNVAEGNFKLHDFFLDQLLQVSPAVRNYYKVKAIVQMQIQLVKLCKLPSGLSAGELNYSHQVTRGLIKSSLQNLEQLTAVLTGGALRMSENERLQMIDHIHAEMEQKVLFARAFTVDGRALDRARQREIANLKTIMQWHSNKY